MGEWTYRSAVLTLVLHGAESFMPPRKEPLLPTWQKTEWALKLVWMLWRRENFLVSACQLSGLWLVIILAELPWLPLCLGDVKAVKCKELVLWAHAELAIWILYRCRTFSAYCLINGICLCICPSHNSGTNRVVFTKPDINIMPMEATPTLYFLIGILPYSFQVIILGYECQLKSDILWTETESVWWLPYYCDV
jgi:hypothetical protein